MDLVGNTFVKTVIDISDVAVLVMDFKDVGHDHQVHDRHHGNGDFSDITVIDDITDIAILRVIIHITVIKDLLISGPVPDPISFQIDPRYF